MFGDTVGIATAGGSGTSTITIDARNGYSGTITFTCAPPATALIGCSVTGSPVTLGGGTTSATVTLSVTTTHAALDHGTAPLWLAGGGTLLAGVFLFGIPVSRRRWSVALTLLTLALIAAAVGCGGSSSPGGSGRTSGTPAGSYDRRHRHGRDHFAYHQRSRVGAVVLFHQTSKEGEAAAFPVRPCASCDLISTGGSDERSAVSHRKVFLCRSTDRRVERKVSRRHRANTGATPGGRCKDFLKNNSTPLTVTEAGRCARLSITCPTAT